MKKIISVLIISIIISCLFGCAPAENTDPASCTSETTVISGINGYTDSSESLSEKSINKFVESSDINSISYSSHTEDVISTPPQTDFTEKSSASNALPKEKEPADDVYTPSEDKINDIVNTSASTPKSEATPEVIISPSPTPSFPVPAPENNHPILIPVPTVNPDDLIDFSQPNESENLAHIFEYHFNTEYSSCPECGFMWCKTCGSADHSVHPTLKPSCEVCGSDSHTTHPEPSPETEPIVQCPTCGRYDHSVHPKYDNDHTIIHQPETGLSSSSADNAVIGK